MSSDNEPAKLLLPYLQRADELQKHEPLVAYYCRLYAMERGLGIPPKERTKTTNSLLVSLMKQLEKDKKSLTLGPDDHLHVEGFALGVFGKADKQDRAGRSDLNTAKTFYAASIFFEILTQFGEVQPDLEQKQKYAVWKAADIRKALKEGRKPIPGPPGGEKDLSRTSSSEYDLEQSRNDFATRTDTNQVDPAPGSSPDPDASQNHFRHSTDNFPQPPTVTSPPPSQISSIHHYPTEDYPSDNSHQTPDPFPQQYHQDNFQHSTNISPQPPTVTSAPPSNIPRYQTDDYKSDNFNPPHSTNNSDPTLYHHQQYHHPYEPQHPNFQSYPSQDVPPNLYPNFQTYPSFTETTLPAAPSHAPYYQGPDAPYVNSPPSNTATHPSSAQYNSSGRNGSSVQEASPPVTKKYEYDSNYQPPPEKIAEAHKAARFAVGALAFDDVSIAVDYLQKSLELLTNPSAGH